MDGKCGSEFQGTSAAAPLAAGIIALLLEAKWVGWLFVMLKIAQLSSSGFIRPISNFICQLTEFESVLTPFHFSIVLLMD